MLFTIVTSVILSLVYLTESTTAGKQPYCILSYLQSTTGAVEMSSVLSVLTTIVQSLTNC